MPEESVALTIPENGADYPVTLRSTVGFTGAGPEQRWLRASRNRWCLMGGITRVITDLNVAQKWATSCFGRSLGSDNKLAVKAAVDLYIPSSWPARRGARTFGRGGLDHLRRLGYRSRGVRDRNSGDLEVIVPRQRSHCGSGGGVGVVF